MKFLLLVIFFTLASPILSQTRPCGPARPCSAGYCCTRIPPLQDTCFSEPEHCCTTRCLSNCWDGPKCWAACSNQSLMVDVNGIHSIVTPELFSEMMPNVDEACQASGFYTYDAFIAAASSFNGFGTSGDVTARKREVAAFLAQAAHEITAAATMGQMDKPLKWTCSTATDPIISFKTAIRLWMTPQLRNPSSHDVIIGRWTPSDADRVANRLPRSFGVVTNIINGGAECGNGWDSRVANRIAFYLRNCEILQVTAGQNLDCYHQKTFAAATSDMMIKMKLDESAA